MRSRITGIALATAAVALLFTAGTAGATGGYMSDFQAAYPAAVGTRIDSCSVCHTSAPARNSYGAAWRSASYSFTAIEGADSDGDGYTNIEEIVALTFPGNLNDHPVAGGDTTAPTIVAFSLPPTASSLTVGVTALSASDDTGVTGYLLKESSGTPAAGAAGWTTSAPANYTFPAAGTRTLYAWAKDAAGNVSSSASASVTITLAPPPPPPPPPPPGSSLFSDTFADATRAGDPDWEVARGRFAGIRSQFVPTGRRRNVALVAQTATELDPLAGGRIEADVRFRKASRQSSAEILFDYQDEANYRYVRLDWGMKRIVVGQVGNFGGGSDGEVLSVRVRRLFRKLTRWHRFRIDLDPAAGTAAVFVDGAADPLITKSFPLVGIGRVGVASNRAPRKAAFDNVEIWGTDVLP